MSRHPQINKFQSLDKIILLNFLVKKTRLDGVKKSITNFLIYFQNSIV